MPARCDWDVLEDLVIWPVITPRGSRDDYDGACGFLCETLNRVPACEPDDVAYESVALVEMRTVTRHLMGTTPKLVERASELLSGYRIGWDLSWAERCKILPAFVRKEENHRSRISVDGLLSLLGRGLRDRPLVEDYLQRLETGNVDLTESSNPLSVTTKRLIQRGIRVPAPNLWWDLIHACQGGGYVGVESKRG